MRLILAKQWAECMRHAIPRTAVLAMKNGLGCIANQVNLIAINECSKAIKQFFDMNLLPGRLTVTA